LTPHLAPQFDLSEIGSRSFLPIPQPDRCFLALSERFNPATNPFPTLITNRLSIQFSLNTGIRTGFTFTFQNLEVGSRSFSPVPTTNCFLVPLPKPFSCLCQTTATLRATLSASLSSGFTLAFQNAKVGSRTLFTIPTTNRFLVTLPEPVCCASRPTALLPRSPLAPPRWAATIPATTLTFPIQLPKICPSATTTIFGTDTFFSAFTEAFSRGSSTLRNTWTTPPEVNPRPLLTVTTTDGLLVPLPKFSKSLLHPPTAFITTLRPAFTTRRTPIKFFSFSTLPTAHIPP